MMGVGEAFIVPMAVAGGLRGEEIGLLSTLPLLFGAFLQTWSGTFLHRLGGRKQYVLAFVGVQAASYLLLTLVVLNSWYSFWILLPILSMYWGSALGLSPAWSSWIGSLTENVPRGRYFALRSQIANGALLFASGSAGYAMQHFQVVNLTHHGFVTMFLIAFVARVISLILLSCKYDPPSTAAEGITFIKFIRDGRSILRSREIKVFLFLVAFNSAVFFSASYFTPYMLRTLGLSYGELILIQCSSIAAKILFLRIWGNLIDTYGSRKVMLLCSTLISVVPVLWVPLDSVAWLCFIQVLTGMVWAGFELASFNLMLGATVGRERISYWAWYNMLNGFGQVGTSFVAGWLLSRDILQYKDVFIISGALRLIAIIALAKSIQNTENSTPIPYHRLFFRVFSDRASFTLIMHPLTWRRRAPRHRPSRSRQ